MPEIVLNEVIIFLPVLLLFINAKSSLLNFLVRILSLLQPFSQPVLNADKLPQKFPPIKIVKRDSPYPGTLLFTNATNPFRQDIKSYKSFIAEIDKYSGKVLRYRHIFTKGYLFQPQSTGYSYAILEKIGVNGGGHDGTHYFTDENLNIINAFKVIGVANGTTDMHEFLYLDNGNVLMLSYRTRKVDLTIAGGHPDALVYDPIVVEQTPKGENVWLWDGKNYLNILDTTNGPDVHLDAIPPSRVDYAHPNALSFFPDGNLLLSLKHMDCVVKIDRQTGNIIWILGGVNCKNNEFTFLNDPNKGFSHQHNVRVLPNGNLLLFDNGTLHTRPESRAVEYEIDEKNKTARLRWSYSNSQFTPAQGSVERLPNGNTLIGWGFATHPFVSEVTLEGKVVLEMNLPEGQIVYRVYQGFNGIYSN
ncbi:MAG: aryl-sulfate sulfotransferase [Xenococcaceae cyanobacterium MO_188.B32]|nr:aryl-sulfate sulfotransferase [Xenococcaceae cyanobacterium MO_188.B32]